MRAALRKAFTTAVGSHLPRSRKTQVPGAPHRTSEIGSTGCLHATQPPRLLSGETYENESFEECLRAITENGSCNISVLGDDRYLGWSYSTGMYDTWGRPEIIRTGFPSGLASSIFESVAQEYAAGKFLVPEQRTPGYIRNVDCIFRPAADVWVRRLMLRSLWFYGEDATIPVLQCLCPDFENRFPWEPGFDERWRARQALLQEGVEKTEAETRLWNISGMEDAN